MFGSNPGPHDSRPETLGSAEYRARLNTKLNCLIAVLEVAIAKISKSLELPGANEDRLLRIRANLENTLSICHRARQTLERTASATERQLMERDSHPERMTARDYVELSSIDEYQKFKQLPPIRVDEIASLDFDELTRRLMGS
ncbi:MAG: hypothetical protein RL148_2163 [Planctomycetota bacterium]|jgi:hypothetical protein